MKKFLRFFVRGGKAVVTAAKTPIGQMVLAQAASAMPFGNLAHSVFTAVVSAEEEYGRGRGDEKMPFAMNLLSVAAPQIVADFERQLGRNLADDDRFAIGMQKVTEGYADILSAFAVMADEGKK